MAFKIYACPWCQEWDLTSPSCTYRVYQRWSVSSDDNFHLRPSSPGQAVQAVEWWIIIDKENKLQLHLLELLSSDTGTIVMSKLKAKYELVKQRRRWWNSAPVIEEVVVSPVSVPLLIVKSVPLISSN